ncbi:MULTISPECIES: DUF3592 domain-containing protein [Salinibaculum]|uniref:DUF3592 domain-containing protein n=1 Tax=Salinibaculum TaxID=2732368 RepID=UPI0030D14669
MNTEYIVVGLAAVVIGLGFAGFAWLQIVPYQEDRSNAEPVDATVISSEVVEVRNSEGQIQHSPQVTYRYTYEGTEYTSSSLYPNNGSMVGSESRAQEIADRYAERSTLTAYVNADNPNAAFLIDESAPLWYWAGPGIGVLLVLYGLYSTLQGIRGVDASSGNF